MTKHKQLEQPLLHIPVLTDELCQFVQPNQCEYIVDATAGYGGHLAKMLEYAPATAKLFGIDQDPIAINALQTKFQTASKTRRLDLINAKFAAALEQPAIHALKGKVSAIYADLGVSSPQLDDAERGFSFTKDATLDMRMDQTQNGPTASDLVNSASLEELIHIFRSFGEEPKAAAVARAIIRAREKSPVLRTTQLADIVAGALHYKTKSRVHPATRVFQALRIAVNNEINELESFLESAFDLLAPRGRLAIITFHSIEDRIVKSVFKHKIGSSNKSEDFNLARLPVVANAVPNSRVAELIKPFPVSPSPTEIADNPRSRSAKLRCLEKI